MVLKAADFRTYLSALWDSVILKDIVRRNKIRNMGVLQDLLGIGLAAFCSRCSFESLSHALEHRVAPPSVKKYLACSVAAYLLADLPVYHKKPRVRYKADGKLYVLDNGFYSANVVGMMNDYARLLENAVFIDLRQRGYQAGRAPMASKPRKIVPKSS